MTVSYFILYGGHKIVVIYEQRTLVNFLIVLY